MTLRLDDPWDKFFRALPDTQVGYEAQLSISVMYHDMFSLACHDEHCRHSELKAVIDAIMTDHG